MEECQAAVTRVPCHCHSSRRCCSRRRPTPERSRSISNSLPVDHGCSRQVLGAGEDDAVSAVSELEVREWMEELGA